MNNLPKSWCVKNDDSQLFKDTVLKYIETKYNEPLLGSDPFYGEYDNDWACSHSSFGKLLTIQEFINLTQPSPKTGDTVWVRDNNYIDGQWVEKTFLSYSNNKKYPFIVCPTDRFETIESGLSIMAQPFQELSTTDPNAIQKSETVKMTVEEIEKELGRKIEIVSKTTTQ